MIAEFSSTDNLEKWLDEVVNPDKYDFYYIVPERRLVIVKNVSTSPRVHGDFKDFGDIEEAKTLASSYNRPIVPLRDWYWQTDIGESSN